ncbi:GAP family protein [Aeromicrobium sp. IC_218]|uniref:GAP family protein n=1 Tax=Aeromicrobium sp. IC_218 TaxID=2545468 RepID=UPI00103BADCE|nr:GAP family protein [Aeromicrobium sp. IC_218]TCI97622.1 GAP family protein [Aeromicrobium sp. IC_218]
MNEVIGDLLPLALGVAISPVPIIAVILMLLAPRARAASVAFLGGWLVGIAVVVTVVALVVDPASGDEDGPATWVSWTKLALGVVAVVLAVGQWRGRPRPGDEPHLPGWMAAIDSVTPARAAGLGALLSALNPKNLTLCLAGGVAIGGGGLDGAGTTVAVVVFTLLGGCSVGVPVISYLVAADRLRGPLDELRAWLTVHNAAVMSVLLLVIGVSLVGKGVGGL